MNRRGFLTGLIAAPAIISIDNLMPVRLWVPTIYGDAVHDDWEGLQALIDHKPVDIRARIFHYHPAAPELGVTSIKNNYLLSRPLIFNRDFARNHFMGDTFNRTNDFKGETIIRDEGLHNFFLNNHFL